MNNNLNTDRLEAINQVINNNIRPYLNKHHGDIEIINYDGKILTIGLTGACKTCPSAQITIEEVVKTALENLVTEVHVINQIDEDLLNLAKKILNKKS